MTSAIAVKQSKPTIRAMHALHTTAFSARHVTAVTRPEMK